MQCRTVRRDSERVVMDDWMMLREWGRAVSLPVSLPVPMPVESYQYQTRSDHQPVSDPVEGVSPEAKWLVAEIPTSELQADVDSPYDVTV